MERRIPYNLEELKLIDCKIHAAQISQLMNQLTEHSQIKKLALVGVHHNIRSFDALVEFVEASETIQEIDLSRSVVIRGSWLKFAKVLETNRSLTNVQLGFN